MAENSGFVGVVLSVTFLLLLNSSVSNGQVSITTQPMNVTVCLTQSATANFTCVVNTQGITGIFTAGWQILDGGRYRSVVGRPHHMTNHIINNDIITDTLTVTNVSVNDNGALYRCEPEDGVTSMIVTITVLDPPAITITEVTDKCTNDFTVSWTATSDEELSYDVVLLLDGIAVVSLMDNSHNFANLIPNTTYNVSVASRLGTCVGIFDTMLITTLALEEGVPQRKSDVTYSATNTAISISWDHATSPADCGTISYILNLYSLNGTDDNITKTITENRAQFKDLNNGTTYLITITAVNRAGSVILYTFNVTTDSEGSSAPNDDDDDDDDNTGAIIGGIIGGIVFLIIVSASTTIIIIWWRNNRNKNDNVEKLTSSTSPESPSPVQSNKSDVKTKKKSGQKPDKKKATSVEQQPVHDAPQYADLQHGKPGAPPSVDRSKVAYCEVKEHEPLKYAEVEHKPGSDEKTIHGAPPIEYKEVWHQ